MSFAVLGDPSPWKGNSDFERENNSLLWPVVQVGGICIWVLNASIGWSADLSVDRDQENGYLLIESLGVFSIHSKRSG